VRGRQRDREKRKPAVKRAADGNNEPSPKCTESTTVAAAPDAELAAAVSPQTAAACDVAGFIEALSKSMDREDEPSGIQVLIVHVVAHKEGAVVEQVLISGEQATVEEHFPEVQNVLYNMQLEDEYVRAFNLSELGTGDETMHRLFLQGFVLQSKEAPRGDGESAFWATKYVLVRKY